MQDLSLSALIWSWYGHSSHIDYLANDDLKNTGRFPYQPAKQRSQPPEEFYLLGILYRRGLPTMKQPLMSQIIHCPACSYTGPPKRIYNHVGTIGCLGLLLASVFFVPLLILIPPLFLWIILKPYKICPKCNYTEPILIG